jgi:hypothetical protein
MKKWRDIYEQIPAERRVEIEEQVGRDLVLIERQRCIAIAKSWAANLSAEGRTLQCVDNCGHRSGGEPQLYAAGIITSLAAALGIGSSPPPIDLYDTAPLLLEGNAAERAAEILRRRGSEEMPPPAEETTR